jgi:hypothetical protein
MAETDPCPVGTIPKVKDAELVAGERDPAEKVALVRDRKFVGEPINTEGFTTVPKLRVTVMGERLVTVGRARTGTGWLSEKFCVALPEFMLVLPAASVTEPEVSEICRVVEP